MASYYKAEDRAEVAIGAYNTCYDRELNLKAEIDGYAKMNQSLVRDCCDLTDEVAELKQFDIRQYIPEGKTCLGCRFANGQWCDFLGDYIMGAGFNQIKSTSCPKPDKGEVV
jgi:hypothetical protein